MDTHDTLEDVLTGILDDDNIENDDEDIEEDDEEQENPQVNGAN